jgi:hypothetical protein
MVRVLTSDPEVEGSNSAGSITLLFSTIVLSRSIISSLFDGSSFEKSMFTEVYFSMSKISEHVFFDVNHALERAKMYTKTYETKNSIM